MKPILEIQSISKKFVLRHDQKPYLSLRESMMGIFKKGGASSEDFYALSDVSFNVEPGESLGIIGRNGAGKSTLLKILSKITPPSSGKIIVRGRIASLLEVGTGFHAELSGRENIYLNGSILGMKRKEIELKFDEIVDFSGTEKFLDTALKHFSSGMQLRLAFAVAAFLEPEILIIDEVLAVGDAEFQKKCIGKMEEVNNSGRTILFVSHNMSAIQNLCSRAIYLDQGSLILQDKTDIVVGEYLRNSLGETTFEKGNNGNKACSFKKIEIGKLPHDINTILRLNIEIASKAERKVALDIRLQSYNGNPAAFGSCGTFNQSGMIQLHSGINSFHVEIELSGMANGLYSLSADLSQPFKEFDDRVDQVLLFEYCNVSASGDSALLQEWNLGYYRLPLSISRV
jgi:lipopolysaccharide transport system ATP-binding protein